MTRPIIIEGYFNPPPFSCTLHLTEEEIKELVSLSSPWQGEKIKEFLLSKGMVITSEPLPQYLDISGWDDLQAPEEE